MGPDDVWKVRISSVYIRLGFNEWWRVEVYGGSKMGLFPSREEKTKINDIWWYAHIHRPWGQKRSVTNLLSALTGPGCSGDFHFNTNRFRYAIDQTLEYLLMMMFFFLSGSVCQVLVVDVCFQVSRSAGQPGEETCEGFTSEDSGPGRIWLT